jgi:hypothetical protein
MRASRVLATASVVVGVGLLSGSAAQVAALDGDLERAVQRPDTPGRTLTGGDEADRERGKCRWRHERESGAKTRENVS